MLVWVSNNVISDTPLFYRSQLLASQGKMKEAQALSNQAKTLKSIRTSHPDLIGSVFWVDVIKGGLTAR